MCGWHLNIDSVPMDRIQTADRYYCTAVCRHGSFYVMRLNNEKDTTITQKSESQFEIVVRAGFIIRTAHWNRVDPPLC